MITLEQSLKSSLKNYTFIDLFAGIGGFRTALNSFGASCLFSSEWDKFSQKIYKSNYGEAPLGDITQIDEKEIPEHDILCGGFPCQAFSISGKQKGFSDTRGTLFFDIARIINHHHPKILLLENVKNIVSHDSGKTLQTILKTLDELGYTTYHKVLNASHYGIPQKRERIFFVCFRKDLNVKKFIFPPPCSQPIQLKKFLLPDSDTEAFKILRSDVIFKENISVERDIFGNTPQKPIRIGTVNKGGQGERIYHEEGHAITLSAYGGGVGAKTGIYHVNGVIRKLTPRECCRLMGFSDSFIIDKNKNQAYKQFGNGVVVDIIQYILIEIIKELKDG